MSLIIIGKMGVAGAGIAAASLGGMFLFGRWTSTSVEIYGFVTTEKAVTDSKFKCTIPSFQEFDCDIKEIQKLDKIASSKQHIQLVELAEKSDPIDIKEPFSPTKFYKIIITESVFSNPKATPATSKVTADWKSITVLNKDSSSTLVTFTSLFFLKGTVASFLGSTNSFIGQASQKLDSITGYKCSWKQDASDLKECTIKPFVKDDSSDGQSENATIASLTFTKDNESEENKKITQHHYYLITFVNPASESKELKDFADKELIYAKDSTNKITFGKLSAVAVVEDQLLILKQQQTESQLTN